MRKLWIIPLLLLCAIPAFGQNPWSNIFSTAAGQAGSRAKDWTTSGLLATMPNGGGTTPNPWTVPSINWPACTTGQAGTTVPIPSGTSPATITAALTACAAANPTGSYLLLAGTIASPSTFTVASANLDLADNGSNTSHNNVELRATSAMAAKIVLTGTGTIVYGNARSAGSAPWTAGFTQGETSLTIGTGTGTPPVGQIVQLYQCNDGFIGCGQASVINGSPTVNAQAGTGTYFTTGSSWNGQTIIISGVSYTVSSVSSTSSLTLTTNYSGTSATFQSFEVGAISDGGGLFLCGGSTACALQTTVNAFQSQTVVVTSVTGTGPYTVGFTPALNLPNWSAGRAATMFWTSAGSVPSPSGIGLRDVTVDMTGITGGFGISFSNVQDSWLEGVRIVGSGTSTSISFNNDVHSLIFSNYFDDYSYALNGLTLSLGESGGSDNLVLNNQFLHGLSLEVEGSSESLVFAYNLAAQTHTLYYENNPFNHVGGCALSLWEGNQSGHLHDDDTFGTCNLNTFMRNDVSGWDPPYLLASQCAATSCQGMQIDAFHRFDNMIGNVIGSPLIFNYQAILSTPTNGVTQNAAYRISYVLSDPLTYSTMMRWGNVDSVTAGPRFCGPGASGFTSPPCSSTSASGLSASESSSTVTVTSTLNPGAPSMVTMTNCTPSTYNGVFVVTVSGGTSFQYTNPNTGLGAGSGCLATTGTEVPTILAGNAATLGNLTPSTTALPCSFFLTGSATTCTPKYSGGTGLSWWKVGTSCTFTTVFSCASNQIQPFPPNGPDITGGPYVSGYSYDIPAAVAFNTLPIDPYYQCHTGGAVCSSNLGITGYSWSATCANQPSGTYGCETITVTNLPANSAHIMGGFQISGATGACNSAAGAEFVMTGSTLSGTTGTITYATSNPGGCSGGVMLWPDVREFDEDVYQPDTSVPAPVPQMMAGTINKSMPFTFTIPASSGSLTYSNMLTVPINWSCSCVSGTCSCKVQ